MKKDCFMLIDAVVTEDGEIQNLKLSNKEIISLIKISTSKSFFDALVERNDDTSYGFRSLVIKEKETIPSYVKYSFKRVGRDSVLEVLTYDNRIYMFRKDDETLKPLSSFSVVFKDYDLFSNYNLELA